MTVPLRMIRLKYNSFDTDGNSYDAKRKAAKK